MKLHPTPTLSPPWGSDADWRAANISIEYHLNRYYQDLTPAIHIARDIHTRLAPILDVLDDLNRITCPRCPDVCCLAASPWYDLRDLIFLHLNRLSIPRTQTIAGIKETCGYAGYRGCTLPRIIRPWICTWYLCPTQTANISKRQNRSWQSLSRVFGEIKALRKELEDEYISAIM